MGATLVKAVLGPRWAQLSPRARLIFAEMAVTAKDSDDPPRYFGGRDELASVLYGDVVGERPDWHHRKVRDALAEIKKVGGIRPLNAAHTGSRAEYELVVHAKEEAQDGPPVGQQEEAQDRPPVEREEARTRPPTGGPNQTEEEARSRPPKEYRGTTNRIPTGEGRSNTKRGTRLDPSWMPSQELIAQMRAECPGVDLKAEHLKFVDYWIAKTGQSATKLDWPATWRNWIRRAHPSTTAT